MTATAIPATTQQTTEITKPHLLNIPGEIRNQIYRELLLVSDPIIIISDRPLNEHKAKLPRPDGGKSLVEDDSEEGRHPQSQQEQSLRSRLLSLFLVNKQIHWESSAYFYSHHTFLLPTTATSRLPRHAQLNLLFRWFLDRIGPVNSASLRSLEIPELLDFRLSLLWVRNGDFPDDQFKILPLLKERCPNLEQVHINLGPYELTWPALHAWRQIMWEGAFAGVPDTRPELPLDLFTALDGRLREHFPALKETVVATGGHELRRRLSRTSQNGTDGWEVSALDAEVLENDQRNFWRVPDPLWDHYYPRSGTVYRSEMALERWSLADRARREPSLVRAAPAADRWRSQNAPGPRIEFARALFKAPRAALRDRREEKEWWESKRAMAQAYRGMTGCSCFGSSVGGDLQAVPMKDKVMKKVKRTLRL
ncbi:hypothetical protein QBC35DRAFT_475212 [Podospora australis]|uniref:DUF7730 domain-containing protein n=1 Tax=Podospora australis TaxID=1536484 RepID=A0AAN6WS43_9PEZI|nr:hypothetical protein QBC35DRAFT_475212 [Podospora australis]